MIHAYGANHLELGGSLLFALYLHGFLRHNLDNV